MTKTYSTPPVFCLQTYWPQLMQCSATQVPFRFETTLCYKITSLVNSANLALGVAYQHVSFKKFSSPNISEFWFHCFRFHSDKCYGKLSVGTDGVRFKFVLFNTNWILPAAPQSFSLLFRLWILNISYPQLIYSHQELPSFHYMTFSSVLIKWPRLFNTTSFCSALKRPHRSFLSHTFSSQRNNHPFLFPRLLLV